jgi:hypothetical protein
VLVDDPDVLVVPMMAYDHILGLPWFQSRNPEIDGSKVQLLSLRTAVGNSGIVQTITSLPQGDRSAEDDVCEPSPAVYIQFFEGTAFDDLLAREVDGALAIQNDQCTRLLGALTKSEGVTSWTLGGMSASQC